MEYVDNSDNATKNVNQDSTEISYTCCVCKTIFNRDNLGLHPCYEGYDHVFLDENLYSHIENGNIILKSSKVTDTKAVVTNMPNTAVNIQYDAPIETKKLELEEQLIDEVFQRPGLWNFKLPLAEREPQVKEKLWEEVSAAMGGIFSIEMLKKSWKLLSDNFRIHLRKERRAENESAATISAKKSWIHLERMQFLRDLYLQDKTTRNIEIEQDSQDTDSLEASVCSSNSSIIDRKIRKRRMSSNSPIDKTAESLFHLMALNMDQINRLIARPSNDKPSLIGNLVTAQLREVDPKLLDEVMMEILKIATDAKKRKT